MDPFISEAKKKKDLTGMINNDTRAPQQAVPNPFVINFQRIHLKLHLEVFELKYPIPMRESNCDNWLYAILGQFSDCTSFCR